MRMTLTGVCASLGQMVGVNCTSQPWRTRRRVISASVGYGKSGDMQISKLVVARAVVDEIESKQVLLPDAAAFDAVHSRIRVTYVTLRKEGAKARA